jgi:predicted PurR-regulated permease PerM
MLSKRRLSPYFLFALLLVLGWMSLRILRVFATYVLLALFLAYLTYPVYKWVLARLKRPAIASLTMLIVLTAAFLVPLGFMTVELVEEAQHVVATFDQERLDEIVNLTTVKLYHLAGLEPPDDVGNGSQVMDDVFGRIRAEATAVAAGLPAQLAQALLGAVVLVYVLYYAYTDGHRFLSYIRDILPMQEGHRDLLFHEVGLVIRAVMYGTILTSLLQAVMAGIGFWLFGIPNPIFWSLLVFLFALLPIVGAPFVWIPWGLYLIAAGDAERGIGFLAYSAVFVNGIEYFLRPKLISNVAHVHPVVILLGVLGGIAVFGFAGLILGPLILSIFVTILSLYRKEFAVKLDEEPGLSRWA